MENVTQDVSQEKKIKGAKKMDIAITDFIMNNDFLIRFIKDNVAEKIYDTKTYNDSMIENVIINDLDNGYSQSYILDFIIDEMDIYDLVYKIDMKYRDDFMALAEQTQQRR